MNDNTKTYDLIDYKGKCTIIQDKDMFEDYGDIIVGEITHEEAIKQAPRRIENSIYYGIPAIITADEDLLKAYNEKQTLV